MFRAKINNKDLDYEFYKELVLQEIPSEPCGKHHKDIAYKIGLNNVQTRNVIRILRNEGVTICSNPKEGYWMARNSSEIQEVINMFASYINSMQNTLDSLEITKIERMKKEGLL